jgi:hypothetical protein
MRSDRVIEASAENICVLPIPKAGKRTIERAMTPKPPIHCIGLRQKRMPFNALAQSRNIVEPVVVKPDIASKNESIKLSNVPVIIKGNTPKSDTLNHTDATMI